MHFLTRLTGGRDSYPQEDYPSSLGLCSRDRGIVMNEVWPLFFFLIEISFDSRIRGDVEELYEIRVKMFVGKVTRDKNECEIFRKVAGKKSF